MWPLLLVGCPAPGSDSKIEDSALPPACHPDGDGDGWGADTLVDCGDGTVSLADDCDDADASVHPEAIETCDGRDEDCDGAVDQDLPTETWYPDADGDGQGDPDGAVTVCGEPAGYLQDDRDCDDADAEVYTGAVEVCADEIDNDCDGADDRSCLASPRSLAYADAKFLAPPGSKNMGLYLYVNPDFPEAGAGEIYTNFEVPVNEEGDLSYRVYRMAGTTGTVQLDSSYDTYAEESDWGAGVGFNVGDLDGDGEADLVVAAGDDADVRFAVYAGPSPGPFAHAGAVAELSSSSAYTDSMAAPLGDQDGDGNLELAVSLKGDAYTDDSGWGSARGTVYVLEGPLVGAVDMDVEGVRITPTGEGASFGYTMCSGDLDGDGLLDLAVGAPSPLGEASAYVTVLLAPFDSDRSVSRKSVGEGEADGTWTGNGADEVGKHLSCRGDVNGDGRSDLLMSAPWYFEEDDEDIGAAWLVTSDVTGVHTYDDVDWAMVGDYTGDARVWSASSESDLDADGRADLVVGVSDRAEMRGRVGVLFDARNQPNASPQEFDFEITGEAPGDEAINVVAGADFNSDGIDDLAVAADRESTSSEYAGAIYIVHGAPGPW